jgi:hypothetical protein
VELARRLSTGDVITAGIDFSFTLDRTHARSSPSHLASLTAQNRLTTLINGATVFRAGTFTTLSKTNVPVKSNPAMRTYRNLFEQEFAGDRRIKDIAGTGLSLGLQTLRVEEAVALLAGNPAATVTSPPPVAGDAPVEAAGTLLGNFSGFPEPGAFIRQEAAMLEELRDILTGVSGSEKLDTLLNETDYLWAHFPDCAGTEGRRPPASDLGFLKRVRAELDLFLNLWHRVSSLA